MVNVIIKNRLPEFEETYFRFESLKVAPHPLSEIRITFKNSNVAVLNRNSVINIDGYDCYIDKDYFDLRENSIAEIHYFS